MNCLATRRVVGLSSPLFCISNKRRRAQLVSQRMLSSRFVRGHLEWNSSQENCYIRKRIYFEYIGKHIILYRQPEVSGYSLCLHSKHSMSHFPNGKTTTIEPLRSCKSRIMRDNFLSAGLFFRFSNSSDICKMTDKFHRGARLRQLTPTDDA